MGALLVELDGDLFPAPLQPRDPLVVLRTLRTQTLDPFGPLVELRLAIAQRLPAADALAARVIEVVEGVGRSVRNGQRGIVGAVQLGGGMAFFRPRLVGVLGRVGPAFALGVCSGEGIDRGGDGHRTPRGGELASRGVESVALGVEGADPRPRGVAPLLEFGGAPALLVCGFRGVAGGCRIRQGATGDRGVLFRAFPGGVERTDPRVDIGGIRLVCALVRTCTIHVGVGTRCVRCLRCVAVARTGPALRARGVGGVLGCLLRALLIVACADLGEEVLHLVEDRLQVAGAPGDLGLGDLAPFVERSLVILETAAAEQRPEQALTLVVPR